jgi:Xaa-Pro aminopeptidase
MTAEGPVNLSAALPRKAGDVENWMAGIYREADGAH